MRQQHLKNVSGFCVILELLPLEEYEDSKYWAFRQHKKNSHIENDKDCEYEDR